MPRVMTMDSGQQQHISVVDRILLTILAPTGIILDNTTGVIYHSTQDKKIIGWKIWTDDNSNKTIEIDILKNGVSIGEDLDLTADNFASASNLSISLTNGDYLEFNVDANTDATKILVELELE